MDIFSKLIPENFIDCFIESIQNAFNELESMNRLLVETGWFYDFDIKQEQVTDLLENENINELDNLFTFFFENEEKRIEKRCIERFPARKSIIKKAFKSYRKKDYETSIILFLTQIDGMFKDISQKSIFSQNSNYKAHTWLIELEQKGKGGFVLNALSALKETKLLSLDFNNAKDYPNVVSRNTILHGYEINFGTKINCLKTMSMINFVARTVYNIASSGSFFDK